MLSGCAGQPEVPLIGAARSGDTSAIATLLAQGADPNQCWGVNGWTPLMRAIHKNQKGPVEALLREAPDLKLPANFYGRAARLAARAADCVDVLGRIERAQTI